MDEQMTKFKSGVLSLTSVEGPLGFEKAKHLLNRCMFGPKILEIESLKDLTPAEAVDLLMQTPVEALAPPLGVKESDEEVPVGTTWIKKKYNSKHRSARMYSYNNWWIGRLIHQDVSLYEKMTLFWHNHFVIENDVVRNSNFNYFYNELITSGALGNFKKLVEEMTVNVGMLQYLDGVKNDAGSPNENYARELFELFTIGKGPLIEEGNYTNYTEHDIREAARVLTGWKTNSNTDSSWFNPVKHDKDTKVFSEIYDGHTISNNEENEYKDLIDMIFAKKETARHIIRKLYRWFVYHEIDEEIEQHIIDPLSTGFIRNNYEMKPLLKTLLCSEHFFDEAYMGSLIKNPLEFSIGLVRQLEYPVPDSSDVKPQYGFWNTVRYKTLLQDMEIGNPPDVAGWPAWYLAPNYNKLWINTSTVPNRADTAYSLIRGGIRPLTGYDKIYFDPFKLAYRASDPSNIDTLINTFTGLLFPTPASQEQIDELKSILLEGLPDFEWTVEWYRYVNDPSDVNQKNSVATRLKNVLLKICSMAEYQLI